MLVEGEAAFEIFIWESSKKGLRFILLNETKPHLNPERLSSVSALGLGGLRHRAMAQAKETPVNPVNIAVKKGIEIQSERPDFAFARWIELQRRVAIAASDISTLRCSHGLEQGLVMNLHGMRPVPPLPATSSSSMSDDALSLALSLEDLTDIADAASEDFFLSHLVSSMEANA